MAKGKHTTPYFKCPNDGKIKNEDVMFICNTCDTKDVKIIEGMYVCPECETAIHPFQCRICDSKQVAFMSPLRES